MHRFIFLILFSIACNDDGSSDSNERAILESNSPVPTGALIISGTIENGEDANNNTVVSGEEVLLERNDGLVVSEASIAEDGSYTFDVAPGSLVVDGSYSLTQTDGSTEGSDTSTTEDDDVVGAVDEEYTYTVRVEIPDDGQGKALGIRKKVSLKESDVSEDDQGLDTIALGTYQVRQVSAIVGTVAFADANVSLAGVDVYIPGEPYFVRTGDNGAFNLLFTPKGTYTLRLEKFPYIKDVSVTVENGVTTNLGTTTFASNERNPLPIEDVMIGTWNVTCYYNDSASGVSPESPKTGTLVVSSLSEVTVTNDSCLLRTMAAAPAAFQQFIVLGDGAISGKHQGDTYYIHTVMSYTNNEITFSADTTSLVSGSAIEVWSRVL
ncbi:hypothetical protein [Pseudobacteriovorax antillogorgiicola]|uniref:Carboxypeptidase regulatory-like domain-containing protein n=1 Tax=Pseudobacteriovorax antillogorgiicola TaxID=1513793 RepID=A0A1Y6BAS3_9BACT|nr:hypothetical protein [Pseudobacteriovorax antillogorgiicola]TCS58501.1 hypothetical protein EDD56_10214 [Pseudobacteriovorax antillogorgiicola]SME98213.1 hypothetical protein SAMN06296036_102429 [Pseudobacteriovorax antillogorgiicola]